MSDSKEILIVEDSEENVIFFAQILEDHGYRFRVARDGKQAMAELGERRPDLVLLDIMLPGIDGYEVCEIVRLNPKLRDIKIIFLTAKGREVEIAKGLALGADAYITKPFSNAELVAQVKTVLDNIHEEAG